MWLNQFETEADGKNRIMIWEPLDTTAPREAQPYCCDLSTIIFYHKPYTLDEQGTGYKEYARVESAWNMLGQRWTDADLGWSALAPFLWHEGHVYELGCGHVVWRETQEGGQWYLRHPARRITSLDHRLFYLGIYLATALPALPAPTGVNQL